MHTMEITRTSQYSGITRTLDLPITEEQIEAHYSGKKIQEAMPHLSSEDREFLMTGITAEEWTEMFCYPDTDGDY